MNRTCRAAVLVLSILAMGAGWVLAPEEFRWETDLEAARAAARDSGRPMLVVFR